jgi:hypothetical protein
LYPDRVSSIESFKDGYRDGASVCFDYRGTKQSETVYKDDVKVSEKFWYEDGTPHREGQYSNYKKEGVWTYWDKEGSVKARCEWKSGNPVGGMCGLESRHESLTSLRFWNVEKGLLLEFHPECRHQSRCTEPFIKKGFWCVKGGEIHYFSENASPSIECEIVEDKGKGKMLHCCAGLCRECCSDSDCSQAKPVCQNFTCEVRQ